MSSIFQIIVLLCVGVALCRGNPAPPPTTESNGEGPEPCRDSTIYCSEWKNSGDCTSNADFMMEHCKKSCDNCPNLICKDRHSRCKEWSEIGECVYNPSFMDIFCKMSCNRCDGSS